MADLIQTLISAVVVGSLYALIALGYTMVYGILKFINFAHSDVFVLGAWMSYTISTFMISRMGIQGDPPWWMAIFVLLLAMVFCACVGFTIERLAYKPLRRAPRLNVLITAIGVSLLLQNVGQLQIQMAPDLAFPFGASPRRMPNLLPSGSLVSMTIGDNQVTIDLIDVIIVTMAISLMLALEVLVYRTRLGAAMRAVSFNTDTAALMGIPVDRVISITFVTGAVLAAAAGFLYSFKYPGLNQPAHEIWVLLGLKAFVAAVVGGIGNVRGAVLGGFLIAFIEFFGKRYIDTRLADVYVFGTLIIVLLVKPTGILGSPIREKV